MSLPRGVFRVKRWWYYQHRRGKPDHGPLVKLPELGTPEFWAKMAEIENGHAGPRPLTVDALIADYKVHPKYTKLSAGSKSSYGPALNYIAKRWGPLRVDGLTPPAIQAFMDEVFLDRPSMGNLTLSVLKTLLRFGVPRGYINTNPAREIEELEEEGEGAKPWPEDIWQKVVDEAPVEISRLAVLGRATGQRVSDLVTMRPRQRDGAGINTGIKKLSVERHWCPLTPADIARLDGWAVFPSATYLADEKGRSFTTNTIRKRFDRYVDSDAVIKAAGIRIHGLRSLAVCDRRIAGQPHQTIAAAIGMSLGKIMHYTKGIDQRLAAGEEREQNGPVKTGQPNVKTERPK